MIIGGFCTSTFVAAQIFPAIRYDYPDYSSVMTTDTFIKTMLLVCAAINGFGAAMLWVVNGQYIADCATPKTKGTFFGIFWVIFNSSQIVGSLVGAVILGSGKS